jgi:hypothetical protein
MTKAELKVFSDVLDICMLHKAVFNVPELQTILEACKVYDSLQNKRIANNKKTASIIAERRKVNKNYARKKVLTI